MSPCKCSASWTAGACRCSWRRTPEPLTVTVAYLYDDGSETHAATLTGLVWPTFPSYEVEIRSLTIDATGEEVDVPRALRRDAEAELNDAAFMQWRSAS